MTAHLASLVVLTGAVVFLLGWAYHLHGRVRWLEADAAQSWVDLQAARADIEAIRRTLRPGPIPKLGIARQGRDHDDEHMVN